MRLAFAQATCISVISFFCFFGCGGGEAPKSVTSVSIPSSNEFLIFPNPQIQPDGSAQTLSAEYAEAYYRAIDTTNTRDTLAKWKAANQFGNPTTGEEVTVVFRDARDLGYGRRMTARRNDDGTIAVVVENYEILGLPGGYSLLNVDAAVIEDRTRHEFTNAIEYSSIDGDPMKSKFVKFFTFSPSGNRKLTVDMDGLGEKPLPAVCAVCHGGRADPLNPPASPRSFATIANSVSAKPGDIAARMLPLEVGTFEFSTIPGFSRADQEASLKQINQLILQTYPISSSATKHAEDAKRPDAGENEWQGTAAEMIKAFYGGDGMPDATFNDSYAPIGWAGHETLYKRVVAPYCRACHLLRGTKGNIGPMGQEDPNQPSELDLSSYEKFQGLANEIRSNIVDRGNHPLSKLLYDAYWTSDAPVVLADFLEAQGLNAHDSNGQLLRPGRPIADPGPHRQSANPALLDASNSLFSDTYAWSIHSGIGATLLSPNSARTEMTGTDGVTYVVRLVTSGNGEPSKSEMINVHINDKLINRPTFDTVRDIFQKTSLSNGVPDCEYCHTSGPTVPSSHVYTDCTACHKLPGEGGSARDLPISPAIHDHMLTDNCTGCHTTPATPFQAPGISHGHYFGTCISCHGVGASGAPDIPVSSGIYMHDSADTCTACHRSPAVVPKELPPASNPDSHVPTTKAFAANICTDCHPVDIPVGQRPPIFFNDYVRAGKGAAKDSMNDAWFYAHLRGRINMRNVSRSPLLRKPSGHHHRGLVGVDFDTSGDPTTAGYWSKRRNYDIILNWITHDAPE
jgi:hypothetical protein